ncbi:MAG: hypothetical protein A2008_08495 [Candidatus Wallbacteria bacterium GWC2_49_35]|uniref:GTP-binding protein n=1 Tax=Candidatus Wallbacteria bacterium GWC2_49_35 TaxID=1817813 RepID=A0A1F7WN43_9BACT|nr:MAG: hypothetical protein A2008_08495 [Candidatus Wallbacteria bacterium GWC2_49_35]HBC73454.1 DUF4416 domain-containing protein [Candidatus Wallbacteria bacterium]
MGTPKIHQPVKLFYGILFNDIETLPCVRERLAEEHGEIDSESEIFDFNFTGYYRKEMGETIKRIFYSFSEPIEPEELSHIKLKSNDLERIYMSGEGRRNVNLDPGYLTPAKVILASAKDNIQRIYMNNGIYEEITLFYKDGTFNAFEWTFPDYRQSYIPFFNALRKKYSDQMKSPG